MPRSLARGASAAAVLMAVLVAASCAWVSILSGEWSMSAAELTQRMAKRFPVERSLGGLVEATLSEPWVTLDEAHSRLAVDFKLAVRVTVGKKSAGGAIKVSGRPEYDPATRSLFMREARVDHVRFDDMSDIMAATLSKAASTLARETLENKPLHVFKPEDFDKQGVHLEPERITVRGDRLVLTLKK